ncbi:MAG: hypothetical protein GQ536_09125 [Candidatus Aminicenantes bacterium]|nr:hypothetical protein [Candidatus Aminicenantes bacterium]
MNLQLDFTNGKEVKVLINSPPEFLMRIAKPVLSSEEGAGIMSIVIQRPFAHLEKELRSTFDGQEDVKIILDSRYGERRKKRHPVKSERRQHDRRRPKEELVEVIIST